jgi:hypothetical protein
MGLCSSTIEIIENIELSPLAKQDVAEKLGVDVNKIVRSHCCRLKKKTCT